ncbi:33733_t:CDS:1, partial [Racocetra persica]
MTLGSRKKLAIALIVTNTKNHLIITVELILKDLTSSVILKEKTLNQEYLKTAVIIVVMRRT